VVPLSRRPAQSKPPGGVVLYAALCTVLACSQPFILFLIVSPELLCSPCTGLLQPFSPFDNFFPALPFGQLDTCLIGQKNHGLGKAHPFPTHQKLYYVAARAAGKALENLFGRIDLHRGLAVVVKWTDADHFLSLPTQR